VWIYTLVFAFSALWFAHFALAALQALRADRESTSIVAAAPRGTVDAGPVEIVDVRPLPPPTTPASATSEPPLPLSPP